ncbi:MAG: hypothetical protein ACREFD_09880 [Stellaceae bacterium]
MDGLSLLRDASAAGLTVREDGGKLVVRGPEAAEPIALRLLAAKPAVLEALGRVQHLASEIPVAWNEGRERMRIMPRPQTIPLARWIALGEAADAFLSEPWAPRAAVLGWDTLNLFGAHPRAPDARPGAKGLIWFIAAGDALIALAADAARLRTPGGSPLQFRRRPIPDPETVPIWQLDPCEQM